MRAAIEQRWKKNQTRRQHSGVARSPDEMDRRDARCEHMMARLCRAIAT